MSNETIAEKTPYKEILELLKIFWFTKNGALLGLQHRHLLFAFLDKTAWKRYLRPELQTEAKSFFEQHGKYRLFYFKRGIISSSRMLDYYLNELLKKGWLDRKGNSGYYTYYPKHKYLMDMMIIHFNKDLQSWKTDEIYHNFYAFPLGRKSSFFILPQYFLCGLERSQFTDNEWKEINDLLLQMTEVLDRLNIIKWMKKYRVTFSREQISQFTDKEWQKIQDSLSKSHLGFYWYV